MLYRGRVIGMSAEDDLAAAHAKLVAAEERTRDQRRYRNHALKAALAAGVTWKRAGEITGLSPRGIQISVRDDAGS